MMLLQRRTDLPVHSCALLSCFFLLMPLSHLRAADAVHGLPAKIELDPLDIVGNRINVQPDLTSARAKLESRAASTAVIDAQSYRNGRVTTVVDALGFAPGVLAQSRHGDEARFSIRGSGIQRGFLMRGIELYQDGIPLNHADGSGDFQSIEPLAAKYIEVWRGSSGLEYGSNALGGAVNFVSPTGRDSGPLLLRTQIGTYDQRRNQLAVAGAGDVFDGFLSITDSHQDGYRQQSATDSTRYFGNIGMRISQDLEARLFLTHLESMMEMPGSISKTALRNDPRSAGANYERLNAHNDYRLDRAALTLSWNASDQTEVETSFYVADRKRDHAMTFAVLQQDLIDTGLSVRMTTEFGQPDLTRKLTLGASYSRLEGNEDRFTNPDGKPGVMTRQSDLDANESTFYGQIKYGLSSYWAVEVGAQVVQAERKTAFKGLPAISYDERYEGMSPKIGVLFEPDDNTQWFMSMSRGYEAPPFGEITVNTQPLAEDQESTTWEFGYRHRRGDLQLDAVIYRSWIDRELLALSDSQGNSLGTVNADKTIHQGLELYANVPLAEQWSVRMNYLFNDFKFEGDSVYGDNKLAGIPRQFMRAELRWSPSSWLYIAPSVEWLPGKTYIDHANTLSASGYSLFNMTVGGELGRHTRWFVEGRNLADRNYAATTAVQANVRGVDGAYYFSGDGRSVYLGLEWRL
ncbi:MULTISPECIES: TonB-dependent receptor family protein [unclassified Pseudomonas]|uniref:TonB-dependent receptor family protein n=1 Tax=unclassified Pseudomonas TaxID=196821 RepID=UPI001FD312D7|nr:MULTISPECIES: TonB-dependent receptor [unclassified Pseudomonas]